MNSGAAPVYVSGFANNENPWSGRIGPVAIWNRPLDTGEQDDVWNFGAGAAYPFVR
jgi:hypothetical protein